jgi:transposase
MMEPLFPLPEEKAKKKIEGEITKKRVIKGERFQKAIIYASLDELLPPDHRVRIVLEMVKRMELGRFYNKIKSIEGEAGRPAIDPEILIAVWLYATLDGVGSARKLARQCEENIAYRWILGGVEINYHTLADFRVDYEEELDELLVKGVAALMNEGLVDLERTAQDGMRVRASAGAKSFHRRTTLETHLEKAKNRVEELKQEDSGEYQRGPRSQAAQERAANEKVERLEKALKDLGKIEEKRKKSHHTKEKQKIPQASSTDPEARFMKMPAEEKRPAYNAELTIDTGSRIIVGVDMVNEVDQGQMDPMLEKIHEKYHQYPRKHLVDGGFATRNDIELAYKKKVVVLAPLPDPRCPGQDSSQPRKEDGQGVKSWRERMTTEEAKEEYKERAATIEWANALARNRGFRQLVVRGIRKVRSILLWFALAHNLMQSVNLRKRQAQAA